eukprot:CAMPEP_0184657268 /NCGR_PEP_ID=MMETSP0308-20130426/18050_1 /TAXON_ID=38269 /ORGANISM="Gloeochaete witrockiana, Strain SAG 46.84" /LENGTH=259 /DNA_ID=CAMNT_0027094885 /DNA_START=49 /DNA_END=825 /DNA_ORIENTATION=-
MQFFKGEDEDENRRVFMETLMSFMENRGTPILKPPTLGHKELDLYKLFQEVAGRGGINDVINEKRWKEVSSALDVPPTCTNSAYTLRTHYVKFLAAFERKYLFGVDDEQESAKSAHSVSTGSMTRLLLSSRTRYRDREATLTLRSTSDSSMTMRERRRRNSDTSSRSSDSSSRAGSVSPTPESPRSCPSSAGSQRKRKNSEDSEDSTGGVDFALLEVSKRRASEEEDEESGCNVNFARLTVPALQRYCTFYQLDFESDW